MPDNTWNEAFSELVATARQTLVRLWKQDITQAALTIGLILALALPLIIVILVLWYLDSTGWRPEGGFYKIGMSLVDALSDGAPFGGRRG